MLQKTNGIVLRTIKYSESSIIVNIYTEKFGLQTYIVNGVRNSKSKGKAALYQHGNLLELVVYFKEQGSIFRISEAKFSHIYHEIPFNLVKGALFLFCIEVLNKTLKEHFVQEQLFQFIHDALKYLDETKHSTNNFHIAFLMMLSKHLGFLPTVESGIYFDLEDGIFVGTQHPFHSCLNEADTTMLKKCIDAHYENSHEINFIASERQTILQHLIKFYQLHATEFGVLHSPQILNTVLHA